MRLPPFTLHDFKDDMLVVCPRCAECAHVRGAAQARTRFVTRLTCGSCGASQDGQVGFLGLDGVQVRVEEAGAPLELWLQTPCRGETLWALNGAHVAALEQVVGAKLRTRPNPVTEGCSQKTLDAGLPAWMLSGQAREEVLRGLGKLRSRLS